MMLEGRKKEMRTGWRREEEMTGMVDIKDGGREEASEEPEIRVVGTGSKGVMERKVQQYSMRPEKVRCAYVNMRLTVMPSSEM